MNQPNPQSYYRPKQYDQFTVSTTVKMSTIESLSVSLGNFSTITVAYYFKRRMGYYLIQVYFPDICVVALSWIVFWMDKNDMGNRMALGITTILTIMFLLGSLNGTLPRVSYPKALDWYLLVSFSFAFLSLVECMIVFVVWLSSNKRKAKKVCSYIQFYHHTQCLTLKNCLV